MLLEERLLIEQIDIFLELQEIDNTIDILVNKTKNMPLKMNRINKEILEMKKQLNIKNENYKSLQVKMKRVELDLREKVNKIEKHQGDLFGGKVSDIKELKQLQKAIAKYKEEKDTIEDNLLVIMEESENSQNILSDFKKELQEKEEIFKKNKTEVNSKIKDLDQEIISLKDRRKNIIQKINDHRFLKQYEMLRKDKGGNVILLVNISICPGCYLDLPSDVVYHLKKDKSMVICPNCSRILIWRE